MLRLIVALTLLGKLLAPQASAQPSSNPAPMVRPGPPAPTPLPPAPPPPPAAAPAVSDFTLLRVDVEDGFALHPWIFHEFRINERWGILFDVHAQTPGLNSRFPPFLELDVGPVLHLGPLQINPQVGLDLAWRDPPAGQPGIGDTGAGHFIPALYLILNWKRISAESWNLFFIPFSASETGFYQMRQLVTVRAVAGLSVGPHLEGLVLFDGLLDRLAIGGDLSYAFRWGSLTLFLAWEKQREVAEFRLTFLREL